MAAERSMRKISIKKRRFCNDYKLTTFKISVLPQIRQSTKLKPLPKFPNIYGIIVTVSFEAVHTAIGLALNDRNEV